jgi:hypothetical protein
VRPVKERLAYATVRLAIGLAGLALWHAVRALERRAGP